MPFYQPLAALELFSRAINGKDIATGKHSWKGYMSKGTPQSTYREGNATVQFEVLPDDAIYNTTTNAPNPTNSTGKAKRSLEKKQRSKRLFKPAARPIR